MTENVESLILELLRTLRNEVRESRQLNTDEHNDIKSRLSHLEAELLGMKRNELEIESESARQQVSIDPIMQRIERLERRLELAD